MYCNRYYAYIIKNVLLSHEENAKKTIHLGKIETFKITYGQLYTNTRALIRQPTSNHKKNIAHVKNLDRPHCCHTSTTEYE